MSPIRTHYHDSEPNNLCSYALIRCSNFQLGSMYGLDPIEHSFRELCYSNSNVNVISSLGVIPEVRIGSQYKYFTRDHSPRLLMNGLCSIKFLASGKILLYFPIESFVKTLSCGDGHLGFRFDD